jgi:uncharacterized membrane protein
MVATVAVSIVVLFVVAVRSKHAHDRDPVRRFSRAVETMRTIIADRSTTR